VGVRPLREPTARSPTLHGNPELAAGVDPKVVAQRGGWSMVATMLDRYTHAIPANDRAAADVLGGMIAGER
jgi:hypothetical protein